MFGSCSFMIGFLRNCGKLDSARAMRHNINMEISGRVHNGVVVLDGDASLPEGMAVKVFVQTPLIFHVSENQKRLEFPLVHSSAPGSIDLTNEQIYEILDDEDVESIKKTWNDPS